MKLPLALTGWSKDLNELKAYRNALCFPPVSHDGLTTEQKEAWEKAPYFDFNLPPGFSTKK